MKATDLKNRQLCSYQIPLPTRRKASIPMQIVGIFSSINGASPNDTVYLDFEGNEGDTWEEEVQNLVFAKTELKKQ
jgi:hypothetical protein